MRMITKTICPPITFEISIASDLKEFPVQVQMKEKNDTITLLYKNVQFTKPAAAQFDAPAGYTVYNNMQEFSAGMMQKMMGAAGK